VTAVPRVLAQLWGRDEPTRRGPKPGLTLETIGRGAVAIADEHGLAAVSMKRVAEAVGVSTMALYRYVDTKEDVFTLMLEFAVGSAPVVGRTPSPTSWREGLGVWCHAYRAVLMVHPWMVQVPLSAPPETPDQVAWMESALLAMADLRLTPQEKLQVLLQVNSYVRGDAALSSQVAETEEMSVTWAQRILTLTAADDFPELHTILASGEFDEDDDALEQFELGLQRMLDGIEILVEQRRD
jgi:AcrR family transcriptional regulator